MLLMANFNVFNYFNLSIVINLMLLLLSIIIFCIPSFCREDPTAMTPPMDCLSSCVYERPDKPGTSYCFALGDYEVHGLYGFFLKLNILHCIKY